MNETLATPTASAATAPGVSRKPKSELSLRRQSQLIDELGQLIAERAQSEDATQSSYQSRDAATVAQFESEMKKLQQRHKADVAKVNSEYSQQLGAITEKYESAMHVASEEYDEVTRLAAERHVKLTEQAKQNLEDSRAICESTFTADTQAVAADLAAADKQIAELRNDWNQLAASAARTVRRRGCRIEDEPPALKKPNFRCQEPLAVNQRAIASAKTIVEQLDALPLARVIKFVALLPVFVCVWLGTLVPFAKFLERYPDSGVVAIAASGATALLTVISMIVFVRPIVKQRSLRLFEAFGKAREEGELGIGTMVDIFRERADERRSANERRRSATLESAQAKHDKQIADSSQAKDTKLKAALEEFQATRASAKKNREEKLAEFQKQNQLTIERLQTSFNADQTHATSKRNEELDISRQSFQRSWTRLKERWFLGLQTFGTAVDEMNEYCERRFPAWESVNWRTWTPPKDDLAALRFGSQTLRLGMFPRGTSNAESLAAKRTEFPLPAVLTFPQCPSLLLEAFGDGRETASRILQNVMLRFLTSLPAGKVRFTIIDPVGLGRNFSAFMHLADFDEKLVSHRIWSEVGHINQRLVDLTEHMQDVIQTYLRNEFSSIEEYNEHAGEVAEPYHVLVVANFPAGFGEEAAQRLVSIANSGARCGVYTLISVDSKLDLPRNFDLSELEAHAATLQWTGDEFRWLDPVLKELPPLLEQPPADELFTEIVRTAGRHAKDAGRVEVPFGTVAPKPERWWSMDSRDEIEIPLGRAGASKLQQLRLGKGTSQHVLIAGKTGSGKSTLLHAMITNLALHYSPQEIQFYLIDFKKGVEFKPYATHRLPHACVVAIESEREFGMSVLERLDVELRRRGDLFRAAGVQDIKGYRDQRPNEVMPRILLVIDEFQEFFVLDDKLAQDAALLLDRLVRQGRAFGIHVMLGSQTLAGAYTLARSTLGQMAVRIALQCSEADSHLILSEENTAARLLSRPGEAIYNDANGLFEGNHPFQVVWIGSNECEGYLKRLPELASRRNVVTPTSIVFEGSAPADPAENAFLRRSLVEGVANATQPQAWLGAAVSIKEPTAIEFRRQSGSNLLIVGQQEELTLGIMSTCVISVAASHLSSRFWVLDGSRSDSPESRFWADFAAKTDLPLTVASPNNLSSVLQVWSDELKRRSEQPDAAHDPWLLLVYNLPRFRDLRKSDDDYGFSSSLDDDKPVNPSKAFATLLREGAVVGLHIVLWCDSQTSVNRWFERSTLRDFDLRILFQMGANDSSTLIDSPAAGKLGVNRAILYSEESGQSEKFRPYGLPSAEWLETVRGNLRSRRGQS